MTDRRDRIAQAAIAHSGCSALMNADVYQDVVIRPVDRVPQKLAYYDDNAKLSDCALYAIGTLRLAGCTEPECTASYLPERGPMRDAMSDIQALSRRFGAWTTSSPPVPPMQKGDVWIIADQHGSDAHTGVLTEDAVVTGETMTTVGCEGGQYDGRGSTAIATFKRGWKLVGGRWMLGNRYLLGYASADRMPVPDTNEGSSDPIA